MQRIVIRELPSGEVTHVYPFHVCLKGTETTVLCRDDDDYDAMVKVIAVAAHRKNVIVVIYSVVSTHCHVAVLAATQSDADAFADEVKRIYSMWFSRKYGETGVLRRVTKSALYLDSDWYVRNALAYIPRNALDNGCNVDRYKWSGYRAMFHGYPYTEGQKVSRLKKRDRERVLHTGTNLDSVRWIIDSKGFLLPESFCDSAYLEQVFNDSQTFFLKTIGSLNPTEMGAKLIDGPRTWVTDGELLKTVEEISQRWFACGLSEISNERKLRLLTYLYRSRKTSSIQLARILGLRREEAERAIRRLRG
jgi:hypothetical protein